MTATSTVHWSFPIVSPLDGAHGSVRINNVFDDSARTVACGASTTLTVEDHSDKIILLDTADGSTAILPNATGSGTKIRFVVSVLPSGASHVIKVKRADDVMVGVIRSMDDTSANLVAVAAAATSNTITLDATNGGVTIGEHLEVEDIAANTWLVSGVISNTGDVVTPFSATAANQL